MFYFSYNCCRSEMDREGKRRVCVMVVHAGRFIGFDAILTKSFISVLLFATVHGVITQLGFVGRMSVHLCLFSPKQPHHGCALAVGSEAPYAWSLCTFGPSAWSQCVELGTRTGTQISAQPSQGGQ